MMTAQTSLDWVAIYPRAKQRFPHLRRAQAPNPGCDREAFVAYLALTHHLTLREAREEIDDFLFTESLHAELNAELDKELT
ncbi:hypothetical protein PH5382_02313 [Phaeobacter sp. CECT 5382]|nr:hypothetical protein PH5382_02313 [Phaeobacter sp. CECT 5382]